MKKLGFTQDWADLNIVTFESLTKLVSEYEQSDDRNIEHYRWRAFKEFLKENKALPPETIFRLYGLGETDADWTMGGAMMRELLDRKDCPSQLLTTVLQSDRDFIVKAAQGAVERRSRAAPPEGPVHDTKC